MHSQLLYVIARRRVAELAQESSRAQLAHDLARTEIRRRLRIRLGRRVGAPTRPDGRSAAGSWRPFERNAALAAVDRTEFTVVPTRGLSGVRSNKDWVES
jgi:hypothetical protein